MKVLSFYCLFAANLFLQNLSHAQHDGQEITTPTLSQCSNAVDPARCTAEKLAEQINKKLVYPTTAIEQLVEGTVLLGFTVDSLGKTHSLKILKDIGAGCGQAAIKAFPIHESWIPAEFKGQPVNLELTLPVHFALRDTLLTAANAYTIHWGNLSDQTHIQFRELKLLLQQSPVFRNQNGDVVQPVELYYVRLIPTRNGRTKVKKFKAREALLKHLKPDHSIVVVGIIPYKRTFLEVSKEWIISR
jgi:hypothetical protein